jgi:hypothetical protein
MKPAAAPRAVATVRHNAEAKITVHPRKEQEVNLMQPSKIHSTLDSVSLIRVTK